MEELDFKLFKQYMTIQKGKETCAQDDSINDDNLDLFMVLYFDLVNSTAKDIVSADFQSDSFSPFDDEELEDEDYEADELRENIEDIVPQYIEDEEDNIYIETLKKSMATMLLFKDDNAEKYINEILANDIDEVLNIFRSKVYFTSLILKYYYAYVILSNLNNQFEIIINKIINDNIAIRTLQTNKGYRSINELCRNYMSEIFMNLSNKSLEDEQIYNIIDKILRGKKHMVQDEIDVPVVNGEKYDFIQAMPYINRLIISDVYTELKASELRYQNDEENNEPLNDEEKDLLCVLEVAILEKNYNLDDKYWRNLTYEYFFDSVDFVYDNREDRNELIENEEVKCLKLSNPLYFLD